MSTSDLERAANEEHEGEILPKRRRLPRHSIADDFSESNPPVVAVRPSWEFGSQDLDRVNAEGPS